MNKEERFEKVIEYPELKLKGVIFDEFNKPIDFFKEWFFSMFLFLFLTIVSIPAYLYFRFTSERKVYWRKIKKN